MMAGQEHVPLYLYIQEAYISCHVIILFHYHLSVLSCHLILQDTNGHELCNYYDVT
jgi:hypothetical protein